MVIVTRSADAKKEPSNNQSDDDTTDDAIKRRMVKQKHIWAPREKKKVRRVSFAGDDSSSFGTTVSITSAADASVLSKIGQLVQSDPTTNELASIIAQQQPKDQSLETMATGAAAATSTVVAQEPLPLSSTVVTTMVSAFVPTAGFWGAMNVPGHGGMVHQPPSELGTAGGNNNNNMARQQQKQHDANPVMAESHSTTMATVSPLTLPRDDKKVAASLGYGHSQMLCFGWACLPGNEGYFANDTEAGIFDEMFPYRRHNHHQPQQLVSSNEESKNNNIGDEDNNTNTSNQGDTESDNPSDEQQQPRGVIRPGDRLRVIVMGQRAFHGGTTQTFDERLFVLALASPEDNHDGTSPMVLAKVLQPTQSCTMLHVGDCIPVPIAAVMGVVRGPYWQWNDHLLWNQQEEALPPSSNDCPLTN